LPLVAPDGVSGLFGGLFALDEIVTIKGVDHPLRASFKSLACALT